MTSPKPLMVSAGVRPMTAAAVKTPSSRETAGSTAVMCKTAAERTRLNPADRKRNRFNTPSPGQAKWGKNDNLHNTTVALI